MAKCSLMLFDNEHDYLWNEFVMTNPNAHPYLLWEWGELLYETYKLCKCYSAVEIEREIAGILPLVHIRSRFFADKLISMPFCEYGGPLIKDSAGLSANKQVFDTLSKHAIRVGQKLRVDYVELRNPASRLSSDLLSSSLATPRYVSFRLDLAQTQSELWKKLNKKTRNAVRKATKEGIKISYVDTNNLKQYYELYLETQKRHGSPPHSYAFFLNLYNNFKSRGWLQMIMAIFDDKPIAGVTVLSFGNKLYWWNNATQRKYASLNPTNLLLWHIIRWGVENNFKTLDLGRTRPDTGVFHFKSGWGGHRVSLENYFFCKRNVEVPDPLQMKYVFLSKLWSRLPISIARRMGPRIVSQIGL